MNDGRTTCITLRKKERKRSLKIVRTNLKKTISFFTERTNFPKELEKNDLLKQPFLKQQSIY